MWLKRPSDRMRLGHRLTRPGSRLWPGLAAGHALVPAGRAVPALEGRASSVPIARAAVSRTRACRAGRLGPARPHDRRQHASVPARTGPRPPIRPGARCTRRCMAAGHRRRRRPGNARRPRSAPARTGYPGRRARAGSAAAPSARTAAAPGRRLSARREQALTAQVFRLRPAARGDDPGTPPRSRPAGRTCRWRSVRPCAPNSRPGRSDPASSLRSRCRPGLPTALAASRGQAPAAACPVPRPGLASTHQGSPGWVPGEISVPG
jgi:hypothetical protein